MPDTAIFDVDGTLVDTNYQHALAWFRAFRRYGITLPMWRIHRGIGMGGDMFVAQVAGREVEKAHGDELREAWVRGVRPVHRRDPAVRGRRTSCWPRSRSAGSAWCWPARARPSTSRRFLDLIDGRSLADAWTTSDDVEKSKPAPDIVAAALAKVEGASGMHGRRLGLGRLAGGKLDIPTVGVLTGGFSVEELQEAGRSAGLRLARGDARRARHHPVPARGVLTITCACGPRGPALMSVSERPSSQEVLRDEA